MKIAMKCIFQASFASMDRRGKKVECTKDVMDLLRKALAQINELEIRSDNPSRSSHSSSERGQRPSISRDKNLINRGLHRKKENSIFQSWKGI